jgi:hypothetical protein
MRSVYKADAFVDRTIFTWNKFLKSIPWRFKTQAHLIVLLVPSFLTPHPSCEEFLQSIYGTSAKASKVSILP